MWTTLSQSLKGTISLSNKIELSELWPVIEEVILSGGEFHFTPYGTSMLPLIRPGQDSVVFVLPDELKKTDIVLYKRRDGSFILHRIMLIQKDNYIMCGDNQNYLERDIKREQILALVKDIYRDGKKVNTETDEYRKYIKSLYKKVRKSRFRLFLSRIKHKIFK